MGVQSNEMALREGAPKISELMRDTMCVLWWYISTEREIKMTGTRIVVVEDGTNLDVVARFEAPSPATIWNARGHFGGDPTSNWGLAGRPRAGFGCGSLPAAVKAGRDLQQSI